MENKIFELIEKGESEKVEFKESLSVKDEIGESVSAFSNSDGGKILVGVSDKGEVKGIEVGKKTVEELANFIKQNTDNHIYPVIRVCRVGERDVIVIEVKECNEKPVFFRGKAYKRVGRANHKLSASEIRKLAKESSKSYWDEQICENATLEDIDWDFVKKEFIPLYQEVSGKKITSKTKWLLESLDCIKNNKPTNAGILLFGKKSQKFFKNAYIALARYKGNVESAQRLDYKEFEGNIFQQIDKCNNYIKEHMAVMSILYPGQIKREDIYEYGLFSIRELITNAICHRDYSDQGSKVIIKMFDNRIDYYNPGGLEGNITPKNIAYRQYSRNPAIAKVLSKIEYIEELGEGWNKIIKEHKEHSLKPKLPKIIADKSSVLVSLFSTKEKFEKEKLDRDTIKDTIKDTINLLPDKERIIIEEMKKVPFITAGELAVILNINLRNTKRNIEKLKAKGLIRRAGGRKHGYWEVVKKDKNKEEEMKKGEQDEEKKIWE